MRRIVFLLLFAAFSASGEVWFVPGWLTGFDGRTGCVRILKDTFPGQKIVVKSWDSRQPWPTATRNAELFTETLFAELSALPESELRELVLIGHSIGGRIVLNLLNRLAAQGKKVHSAALLAVVVPCDSALIPRALDAVRFEICDICNPDDLILKDLYPLDGDHTAPLGYSGWVGGDPRLIEGVCRHDGGSFLIHFAYLYLEELACMYRALPPRVESASPPRRPADTLFWQDVESCGNWRLQLHYDGRRARLLDPDGVRRAAGDVGAVRTVFADVKRQLDARKVSERQIVK